MKSKTYRGILGHLLVLLFLTYLGGIIACYHVNIVDGRLVAHAHLQTKESANKTHTAEELLQLDQLSHIQVSGSILPVVSVEPYFFFAGEISLLQKQIFLSSRPSTYGLRAPPFLA